MCIYGKLVRTHSACYWANVSKVNSHDLHGDPGKQASPPYRGSEWREPSVHTTRASRGDASATLTLFFCGSRNAQLGQQPGSMHCYEHGMVPNLNTTCKVASLFHFAGGRDTGTQRGGSSGSQTTERNSHLAIPETLHSFPWPLGTGYVAQMPMFPVAALSNLKSFLVCLVGELIS